ncbi:hypothetical protein HDU83_001767 [Entophlyctis luteolus]|nr:hypothetical protein HDU83_001767 [Entophlyctis luteolus]
MILPAFVVGAAALVSGILHVPHPVAYPPSGTCSILTAALSLYEPADGKVIWGAWVDSSTHDASAGTGGDSPSLFNSRLGSSAGVFELSQNLPLAISPYDQSELTANLSLIEATKTDAILLLTVYPFGGFDAYTDADILKLAYQVSNITDPSLSSRRVILRFAPEMNGNWFNYGMQPTRFVTEWKRVVNVIRAVTKRVAFVWSPNASNGYPWKASLPSNSADAAALDKNNDGSFTSSDDPFSPYWPGADFVDWVGISLYWKGDPSTSYPLQDNSAPPSDVWTEMVQGGGVGGNSAFPFYTMFADKYEKPLMMAEGGAAFALSKGPSDTALSANAGQLAIEQGFWRSYLNTALFSSYPKAKMFINFEFMKLLEDNSTAIPNNGVNRDYRITWNSDVLSAFKSDIAKLSSTILWAGAFVGGVDPLTIGAGSSVGTTTATGTGTKTSSELSVARGVLGLISAANTKNQMDLSKAVGFKLADQRVHYNRRDLILYALAIGATDLSFTYELSKNFCAFPTYPLVLPLKGRYVDVNSYADQMKDGFNVPGLPKIDLSKLVHGDQSIEIVRPIPSNGGDFVLRTTLLGVYDAGKGMIIDKETLLVDAAGQIYTRMTASAFVIGAGGFGGPKRPKPARQAPVPSRDPDFVQVSEISPQQAMLYRLSGDYNPLHADPSIGKRIGMKGAILHGLCTFGFSAAAILAAVANNDATRFKFISGKFAAPVYPGDKLETRIWKVSETGGEILIAYVALVGSTVVITGGVCVLATAGAAGASKL